MVSEDSKNQASKWRWVLPIAFAATLTAAGWLFVEFLTSYKDFVRSEIRIENMAGELGQVRQELAAVRRDLETREGELQSSRADLVAARMERDSLRADLDEAVAASNSEVASRREAGRLRSRVDELERELSTLRDVYDAVRDQNRQLKDWVASRELELQACSRRPTNTVDLSSLNADRLSVFRSERAYVGRPKSISHGTAWIHVVDIGRDETGNFATVRSSLLPDADSEYCIRIHDAFEVEEDAFLVVTEIDDTVRFHEDIERRGRRR